MQVWNVLHAALWKYRTPKVAKNCHLGTIAQLCWAISSQLWHVSTIGKKLLSSNISSTCPHKVVNSGVLAAEIDPVVWGTPPNFNRFRILAALLHSILVVGISQTLRRWTEGASYIRQGDHYVGHWPTFLVKFSSTELSVHKIITHTELATTCAAQTHLWSLLSNSNQNNCNTHITVIVINRLSRTCIIYQLSCNCFFTNIMNWWRRKPQGHRLIDVSSSFATNSTQNRSFRRRSPSRSLGLVRKN